MDIKILKSDPLELYVENDFESEKEKIIAERISEYIFHYFSYEYEKIDKINYNEIKPIFFKAIDSMRYKNGREQTKKSYFIHFFGFDGKKRLSYQEIANENGVKSVESVKKTIYYACKSVARFLEKNDVYNKLFYPEKLTDENENTPEELIECLEDAIRELEKQLFSIKSKLFEISKKNIPSSIDELEFSIRTHNILTRARIETVAELTSLSKEKVFRMRNMGRKSYEEIIFKLSMYGLSLEDK